MTFDLDTAERRDKEYDLLLRIASAATDVVNECGHDLPPSLGSMAKLADAVHAHWKFQSGDVEKAKCNHWPGQPRCEVCGMEATNGTA